MSRFTEHDSSSLAPNTGRLAALLACVLAFALLYASAARAVTAAPHWTILSTSGPTNFSPGETGDYYTLIVRNDGGLPTDGSTFTVAETLPAGIQATAMSAFTVPGFQFMECAQPAGPCTSQATLAPGDFVQVEVSVAVASNAQPLETASATVSGGGAPVAHTSDPTTISFTPAPFGPAVLAAEATDVSGGAADQAGSHPFDFTTSFAFSVSSLFGPARELRFNGEARNIDVALPPGLVGNPNAVPQCSQAVFEGQYGNESCPADSQVGIGRLFFYGLAEGVEQGAPIYNIAPPPGQPAELGLSVGGFVHIPIFFRLRSDGNYGLTAYVHNLTEAYPVRMALLSFWGVPADPSHDADRLQRSVCEGGCGSTAPLKPFLTMPTSCQQQSPTLTLATDSWQQSGAEDAEGAPDLSDPSWKTAATSLPALTGCERLSFVPAISVRPDTAQAGAPSGYTIDIHVPQNDDPNGLATPDLERAHVRMPAGTVISPPAGDGLQACSDDATAPTGASDNQFGLHSTAAVACPAASQVGTLRITTPLLPDPLEGHAYLGKPECDPCSSADAQQGRMVKLLLEAQGPGVRVKVMGSVAVDQQTGQLTASFDENPPLPFEDLSLSLNAGSRAPLANGSTCAIPLQATAAFTPNSSDTPVPAVSDPFTLGGCPSQRFGPAFTAGTTSNQAGAFSPFSLAFSRADDDQDLGAVSVQMPPGLLGVLKGLERCGEPQASAGTCGAGSLIGQVAVTAGSGSNPLLVQGGRVYLTGPYKGAPFGLSIVVNAVAGPFDLGNVVVRAAIEVDPHTARLTVLSDPLPSVLDGIPLHLRTVNVTVDRSGFIFNPTNCEPLSVDGTLTSTRGTQAQVSSRFQAANCASLPFKPSFKTSTQAKTSKRNGASLDVKVGSTAGQANVGKVAVSLPKQLPSRLTTIQQACPEAVFDANPATCPAGSDIGTASASTPVLASPLAGPAYLVSHGGAAFPDLVLTLQGEGITLDLVGSIDIRKGVTSSTFASVPDAPISSFELKLPEGPHSALAAVLPAKAKGNLCGTSPQIPTTITGQNGAQLKQSTRIAVSGCPKAKKKHKAAKHKHNAKKGARHT
jgi:hypothetical protein